MTPDETADSDMKLLETIMEKLDKKNIQYKFNEEQLVAELKAYIDGTYTSHYVGTDNVQAFELIAAAGHGMGFTIGDIIKYASRYGKKGGRNRQDLLKILHYTILALYVHDKEIKNGN
ncbi:SaV-like [uncultured Caudovirales phage]|uniref:SaV-like n=1 Tax=uncultured Caudovirales phage TaxID=2100421 RepID=A0A6J5L8N8_9CAUD|nr:SaV-like [uncultured Caudovirales phage]